ncbi:hypothetical protein ACFTWH_27825, partial [Streptomyces sp. NPDC057011]
AAAGTARAEVEAAQAEAETLRGRLAEVEESAQAAAGTARAEVEAAQAEAETLRGRLAEVEESAHVGAGKSTEGGKPRRRPVKKTRGGPR